jgi:hypothetical protein
MLGMLRQLPCFNKIDKLRANVRDSFRKGWNDGNNPHFWFLWNQVSRSSMTYQK